DHAPLFQLELAALLGERARVAAPRDQAIATGSTLDPIPAPRLFAVSDLEDPSGTQAGGQETVEHAVATTGFTAVGVGVSLGFHVLKTGLVLAEHDAWAPSGDDAYETKRGEAVTKAAAETVTPFTFALAVEWNVFDVAVTTTAHGHAWGRGGLLVDTRSATGGAVLLLQITKTQSQPRVSIRFLLALGHAGVARRHAKPERPVKYREIGGRGQRVGGGNFLAGETTRVERSALYVCPRAQRTRLALTSAGARARRYDGTAYRRICLRVATHGSPVSV
ncbi:10037_t:CDS:2, partial [Acaulospora colombiana]